MFLKIFSKPITYFLIAVFFCSCSKEEDFKPVNMNELNPDVPLNTNSALDQWLKTNLLDMYNSEVIYRYSRYDHEYDRNITPIDEARVRPFMQSVISGFADPYVAVAGLPFMKVNMPKQWVLYGSSNYSSTTVYWGSAVGGVRVNIFDLNSYSTSNVDLVKDRLGTIHHEFTHILNQRAIMPVEFAQISKAEYTGTWETISVDSAQKVGFMRGYSMQNPMEDFADMVKYPVVWGPSWFDDVVRNKANTKGAAALRAKEQSVVNYFSSSLNMDFRAIQKKVQMYVKDSLKDPQVTFPYWINRGLYKTVTVNLGDPMFATYGSSSVFANIYNAFKDSVRAASPAAQYRMESLQFRFESPTSLVIRMPFTATSGSQAGTTFNADFSFSVAVNSNTGTTSFTKIAQGTTTTFTNANSFLSSFGNTIQAYLTSGTFVADWIPLQTPPSMYTKTGGFTKTGEPSNYFYGTLGQTL
jgi:substrate import-associated zinc metallohydrolase lipoprotein